MPDDLLLVVLFATLKLVALGFGAALLLPVLRDERVDARTASGEDDDHGGSDRIAPRAPRGPGGDDGIPLPDAVPARVRLRDGRHGRRLADLLPGRQRRPQHAPDAPREPASPR